MTDLPPSPTPARDVSLAAWESAPTRAWLSLSQGSFLRGFLLDHGVGNFALAIIDNLPLVTLIIQPLVAMVIGRSPALRAITLRAMLLERGLCLLPILLVLLLHWTTIPTWALVLLGLSYGAGAVALAGWMTWLAELTEGIPRGAFVARRSAYDSLMSILLGLSASALLDWLLATHSAFWGYFTIFLIAGLFGIGTFLLMGAIRTMPSVATDPAEQAWHTLQRPLRKPGFRRYLAYILGLHIGQAASGPFWLVYMLKELHWSYTEVAIYGTIATLASLACYRWWGGLADRVGTIPLLRIITFCRVLNPLLWLMLTPENAWWILVPEAILTGVFVAGIVPLQLVYALKESTGDDRSAFLSLFYATQGIGALAGATLGGAVTTWWEPLRIPWGAGWTLLNYHLVFCFTAAVRLGVPFILAALREPEALRIRELWPILRESLRISPSRPKFH